MYPVVSGEGRGIIFKRALCYRPGCSFCSTSNTRSPPGNQPRQAVHQLQLNTIMAKHDRQRLPLKRFSERLSEWLSKLVHKRFQGFPPRLWMLIGLVILFCGGMTLAIKAESWFTASSPVPVAAPSASVSPSPSPSAAPAKQTSTGKLKATQSLTEDEEPTLTAEQQQEQQAAIASLKAAVPSVDALIEMKVAIEVAVPAVRVGVSAESQLLDGNGELLSTLTPGASYTAQVDSAGIVFDGAAMPALIWVEPAAEGLFYLNDRAYRGRLLLAADQGKLWAVNVVSMRNYLHSVVPSEVSPSWNVEALKAQAVAARSYALTYYFQPINDLYHMGDDEYFQVYKGIESEAESTGQAVDATAGEFVSYRGGVVESLYAASDDIVAEAFQGKGMSQLGALNLAEQGYKYDQILSTYYPSTGIGKIAQDTE